MADDIVIVTEPIPLSQVSELARQQFGDMVKAVVDLERAIMAIGGELHADEEAVLLEDGSSQDNLWGINLYPADDMPDRVEFDSMINVRPSQGNRSREVEDPKLRTRILELVGKLVT